jgi:heme exporter protein B
MVRRRGFNHTGCGASTASAARQGGVLEAEGIAAFRGERLVFRDLSFTLSPGETLVLGGPNGSGKSTLLRLLAGLLRPASGRLLWNGKEALSDLPQHARRVAYLGHQDAIKPGLTAAENLQFAARVSGASVCAGLQAMGLEELADLPARMLSAGQKRRLALARLALSSAPLWLVDEPTVGLDSSSIALLATMLKARQDGGGMLVVATHVPLPLSGAAELCLIGGSSIPVEPIRDYPPKQATEISPLSWERGAAPGERSSPVGQGISEGGLTAPRLFSALLARELHLSLRHSADTTAALLFFLVVIGLFPLAIGPGSEILGRIAPGVIWVAALLAAVLPLDRLFGSDFEDGSVDLLLLSGLAPSGVTAAKAAAHWLVTGVPLLVATGPLGAMLYLSPTALPAFLLGLLLGTGVLSLLGTAGAAVVLGARRGGVLLPLLVLPLAVPVLVFGAAAADAAAAGVSAGPHLLLLGALFALALPLCPLAAGAALQGAVE